MRKIIPLITALLLGTTSAFSARINPTTGRVVDEQGEAVKYATIVLLRTNEQVAGMATDTEGRFSLYIPAGDYTLSIQYLGYDPIVQPIRVERSKELGDFTLKSSATQIDGVVVKAQLIRREADRFVVDVANTPSAIGKDGIELLQQAPGVWITEDKISINGKSGSKIYINDRELKMETAQLLAYLRSLRAEDIQKIEVIPTTGADYDADSTGGILKLTLKKQREKGIEGTISFNTTHGKTQHAYSPNGNINYHAGKLDLSASAWGWLSNDKLISDETTDYATGNTALKAHSKMLEHDRYGGFSIGSIYACNDRHSVGAEFSYMYRGESNFNETHTDFITEQINTRTKSRYDSNGDGNNFGATFNYIYKIDTLGSTLKFLADYTRRKDDRNNDNFSHIVAPGTATDSTYRDNTANRYNIITATLALEKKFSDKWSLKAGIKYTNNDMRNNALYEYLKTDIWQQNTNQSFRIDYSENIAAAYGIASAKLGRWSLVAGLRGEYTRTSGKGNEVKKNYFGLFPNANISYSLKKDGSYSLAAQYARTINRPSFWALTPLRMQISDYTYQIGNPLLKPAYNNELSLTLIMKYKYSLTAGANIETDKIQQNMMSDAEDPNKLYISWENFDTTHSYYLSANLPFQPTKWWSLNANATYIYQGSRFEQHGGVKYHHFLMANLSTTFTLPAKFYIDIAYSASNRMTIGNLWVSAEHRLQAGIKKRFFNDRITASFSVENLLDQGQTIGGNSENFVRKVVVQQHWNCRTYKVGVSYNFKAGKTFRNKSIETDSAEEKRRL